MAVTNDLVSDNRVHKMALTLADLGYDIMLVGRIKVGSLQVGERPYLTHRFRLPFQKGPFFYASYNTWLFFYLLTHKSQVIWSNDLDTLPACYIASRLTKRHLVYDSHELFTEVPELVTRPNVQRVWERIEKMLVPRLKCCITVCRSIANYYIEMYGIRFQVVRNVPFRAEAQEESPSPFPAGKTIILYQGSVNMGRGVEEAIMAMHHVEGALLAIIGDGDLYEHCQKLAESENLMSKVAFLGRIPFQQTTEYTRHATIGLTVEKNLGLNYRFALPNKLFDYIQSGVPVLASALPEISNIVYGYQVGRTIPEVSPQAIAAAINQMLSMPGKLEVWKENCHKAAEELCWEKERETIKKMMHKMECKIK